MHVLTLREGLGIAAMAILVPYVLNPAEGLSERRSGCRRAARGLLSDPVCTPSNLPA